MQHHWKQTQWWHCIEPAQALLLFLCHPLLQHWAGPSGSFTVGGSPWLCGLTSHNYSTSIRNVPSCSLFVVALPLLWGPWAHAQTSLMLVYTDGWLVLAFTTMTDMANFATSTIVKWIRMSHQHHQPLTLHHLHPSAMSVWPTTKLTVLVYAGRPITGIGQTSQSALPSSVSGKFHCTWQPM